MQDRRMFLAGAAATVALPVVGGGLAWAQSQGRRVAPRPDAVLAEVQRQVIEIARKATRPGRAITGETARQLSSATRMLNAHLVATGFDVKFNETLRKLSSNEGRTALINRRTDLARVASELRQHGLDIDVSRISPPPDDPQGRAKALDALLQRGLQPSLQRLADDADVAGGELDKFVGGRLVQFSWPHPNCTTLQWDLFMLEIMMIVACGPLVETVAACVSASVLYITYSYLIWSLGC